MLNTLNIKNIALNPGHPYAGSKAASKTQNGFASFGGPDIAATLAAVAAEALKAVWYQKWWVHLRHRPESGGAIVHLQKTGKQGTIEGHVSDTVLNSQGGGAQQSRQTTAASFCRRRSPKDRRRIRPIRPGTARSAGRASRC